MTRPSELRDPVPPRQPCRRWGRNSVLEALESPLPGPCGPTSSGPGCEGAAPARPQEGNAPSPHVEEATSLAQSAAVEPPTQLREPHRQVLTLGQSLLEVQLLEALQARGARTLLDCRSPQAAAQGHAPLTRRAVGRCCERAGVQHQHVGSSVGEGASPGQSLGALRAALAFALRPVALLCVEADPRNGARRALGDALAAEGWDVVHLCARGVEVVAAPHGDLFQHPGNAVAWPPGRDAIPGLRELAWPDFAEERLRDGGRYRLRLPWDTELIWVPDWLPPSEADRLQQRIEQEVHFQQPLLRFERGLRAVEARQPRRSAWVSDRFNQPERLAAARAAGRVFEPSVIAAQPLQDWSRELVGQAERSAGAAFNALLLHSYDHGRHSMGLHSDTDAGLGDAAVIASFSLGATRTFVVKSQAPWQGRRIELHMPVRHGSFLVMGPGFQGRWLHGVLKEPEVDGCRVNGTLRFYDLPDDAALCACGASRRSQQGAEV